MKRTAKHTIKINGKAFRIWRVYNHPTHSSFYKVSAPFAAQNGLRIGTEIFPVHSIRDLV